MAAVASASAAAAAAGGGGLGARLFKGFTQVLRLRRIHRQPGASLYKESLIRLRDAAHTKDDHALWQQHDLCCWLLVRLLFTPLRASERPLNIL